MQEVTFGLNQKKVRGLPFLLLFLFIVQANSLFSQNLRCRTIPSNQVVVLDTTLIEPNSIRISSGDPFSLEGGSIRINSKKDSVEVCYRVLSPMLTNPFQGRPMSQYDPVSQPEVKPPKPPGLRKEELFQFEGVNKFGTISRGISFGNRQNLFVNSSLNLQIDGKVNDDLWISAVITDQNVPFQPEGNTQQLRDFDNVFISLYNDRFNATAGDIVLTNPTENNYFLKYYKNIRGLSLTHNGSSGSWDHLTSITASASKGKFASTIVEPIEGLSGPYRLRGPNGERFIIILANSEKVYLDGRLLKRGFDQDYIIDYNLGEITFNNHIVITQFSVINVDYEYAEQLYARTNLAFSEQLRSKNVKIGINYYREKDNPDQNTGFNLSDNDLDQLQQIGDDASLAFISNIDTVQFDPNRILYIKKDTIDLDGNVVTIFTYSPSDATELFQPSFTEVGQGNGDYILRSGSANGRIYDWVSPINGERQGNYQSGSVIPLPNQRQMVTTAVEVAISPYEKVRSEIAFSNQDLNLYSSLNDDDNHGVGYFGSLDSEGRPSFLNGYKWNNSLKVELNSPNFSFIDRYRPILFERNWNSEQRIHTVTIDK
jgi:hypothetical protein